MPTTAKPLCRYLRDLWIEANTVLNRSRHIHKRWHQDRTPDSNDTLLVEAGLLQTLLVIVLRQPQPSGYRTQFGPWDLERIGLELGLVSMVSVDNPTTMLWKHDPMNLNHVQPARVSVDGRASVRVPAQLVVDLLRKVKRTHPADPQPPLYYLRHREMVGGSMESYGTPRWYATTRAILSKSTVEQQDPLVLYGRVQKNKGYIDDELPRCQTTYSSWEGPKDFHQEVALKVLHHEGGSVIEMDASVHATSGCPHNASHELIRQQLVSIRRATNGDTGRFTQEVPKLLQQLVQKQFLEGPVERFHVLVDDFGGKRYVTIVDKQRLEKYYTEDDDGDRLTITGIGTGHKVFLTGPTCWLSRPGETAYTVKSNTEPLGTFAIKL